MEEPKIENTEAMDAAKKFVQERDSDNVDKDSVEEEIVTPKKPAKKPVKKVVTPEVEDEPDGDEEDTADDEDIEDGSEYGASDEPEETEVETKPEAKTDDKIPVVEEDEVDDFNLDEVLDPDFIDPEVTEKVKSQFNKMSEKIKALKEQNKQQGEVLAAQKQAAYVKFFDEQVASLDGYSDLLGTETADEIDRNSVQFQNRVKLDEQMSIIAAGYVAQGKKSPDLKTLFNMSLNSLFAGKAKAAVPATNGRPVLRRPSKTTDKPKTLDEISLEKAREFVRNRDSGI